ncbi:hypothetical protein GM658_05415 [Pseudoduganella eburnea]|uniref:Uncharacterized protein n=1 Tax=Massilia eburnea TaxID=1776165 RepID=A0A6L6QEC3_9BURK|nr:hypothetical protein [Massilia eburnea]MTW10033.1 hypothetical protein [Massilia eburnea]
MKKTLPLVLAAMLGCAANAAEPPKAPAPARTGAGPAYSEQQFDAAYQHLKKMLAQMERIKATKDPQERERLLLEHRQSMRDGALAMRRLECQAEKGRDCPWQSGHRGPHDRMGMMERRMDMMQMMMEQMIEHEGQNPPAPRQDDPSAHR